MAAVPTGTPAAVTWAAGSDPAGQSITIPADCTAVYMFWSFWVSATNPGLLSATLAGSAPSQTFEIPVNGFESATGVAAWYNPPTGSQTLDPAWDTAPSEGPTCIVVFVKDGDTTAWRDADADQAESTTAVSVTLTTVATDLVLKYNQIFSGTAPGLSAGWTNGQTHTNVSESARLSYISAAGVTQVCDGENENYSTVLAIAIPAAAAGGGGTGSVTAGADLGATFGAVAAASAALSAGVSAGDTDAGGLATAQLLSAAAEADETMAALAQAIAAIAAGVEAGESWAVEAQAAAVLAAGADFGATFAGLTDATQAGALTAGTEAAASFLAAATTIATLTASASLSEVVDGVASALGALTAAVSMGATFAGVLSTSTPTPRTRRVLVRKVERIALQARVDRSTLVRRRSRSIH